MGCLGRFPGPAAACSKLTSSPASSSPLQTERAYQKQPTIFQNKKRVLLGETGKEKLPRYYKNIGLGFKTPKEVRGPLSLATPVSLTPVSLHVCPS